MQCRDCCAVPWEDGGWDQGLRGAWVEQREVWAQRWAAPGAMLGVLACPVRSELPCLPWPPWGRAGLCRADPRRALPSRRTP